MFNKKRERELEEELAALKQEYENQKKKIEELSRENEKTEELLVDMTITKSEFEELLVSVAQQMAQLKEYSVANSGQTVLLKQQLEEKTEQNQGYTKEREERVSTAEAELGKLNDLTGKVQNSVEELAQMEHGMDALGEGQEQMHTQFAIMSQASEQMSVLALNAAMEAQKLGADGRRFVAVADAIRECAQQYTQAIEEASRQVDEQKKHTAEMVENRKQTEAFLQEQEAHVVELLNGYQDKISGEKEKLSIEESEDNVNLQEILQSLCQGEIEFFNIEEKTISQIESLQKNWKEHKECTGKLEESVTQMQRSIEAILTKQ